MPADVAVISAADENYFDLLQGLIRSLQDKQQSHDLTLHVFDLGLSEAQRRWLLVQGAALCEAPGLPGSEGLSLPLQAFLARSRLPELFPGHDVYMWIDADAWVQRTEAIEAYVEGALANGFAVARELDAAYDRNAFLRALEPTFSLFGPAAVEGLRAHGSVNAGVFAGRADAPHWGEWRRLTEAHLAPARQANLLFYLDQATLGLVCLQLGLPAAVLPAACNWFAALPAVSDDGSVLLRPLPPHEPLGIMHQAGGIKRAFVPLRRMGGGYLSRTLGYQAHSQLPADDYVSPGLTVIMPDRCFPNMVRGDQSASEWPYLRRGLPHPWLVDRRLPTWGFLNRDEAHILYNLALGFRGKRALEIGCLLGWSACHIALAGVDLDVIDPMLADPGVNGSVQTSLRAAQVPAQVRLIPQRSPAGVHELAAADGGWSLFMIDGDHEGEAPLADVRACEPYAAADCAMVFHDLASPDVTAAVQYLKERGWQVRVYHTAQIMAVAWRGAVHPVAHQPDPRVDWQIPDHVMPLLT